jgi:hypothetical protein
LERLAGGGVSTGTSTLSVTAIDEQHILYARTLDGIRECQIRREGLAATGSQVAHEQLSLMPVILVRKIELNGVDQMGF